MENFCSFCSEFFFLFFIYSMEPENKYSGVSIKQFNVELGPKSWKPRKIPPPTTKLSNTWPMETQTLRSLSTDPLTPLRKYASLISPLLELFSPLKFVERHWRAVPRPCLWRARNPQRSACWSSARPRESTGRRWRSSLVLSNSFLTKRFQKWLVVCPVWLPSNWTSVGGVPPFGRLLGTGFETFMDESLEQQGDRINFNAGLRTHSINLLLADYIRIEHPHIVNFSKDVSK